MLSAIVVFIGHSHYDLKTVILVALVVSPFGPGAGLWLTIPRYPLNLGRLTGGCLRWGEGVLS